jgi:hypothetical protein
MPPSGLSRRSIVPDLILSLMTSCLVLQGFLSASVAHALNAAKYITAEEITGVVVEAATEKPIPNAIVAIRFERNNTGHSGSHCFRSIAVQSDTEGRFRFAPWRQENTQANATFGQVNAYKAGYAVPWRPVEVAQSNRSIAGIAFSDTIRIPKTQVRLELKPFAGSEQERIWELQRVVAHFTCRWRAEFDDMILLFATRDEIMSSPIANQKLPARGATPYHLDPTPTQWIEAVIKAKTPK